MGNSFAKKSRITNHDKAILDLKIQRDRLKQYQKKIELVVNRETELAKQFLQQKQKQKALLALKKKKYQQTLLEKTDHQLLNLEEMAASIEFALVEQQVFKGLESGNAVLKEIQNEMSLEEVEKLMDDTADAIAYQNEISEMISGKLSEEDEEEILKELEQLETEEIEKEFPSVKEKTKADKKKLEATRTEPEEEEETEKREAVPA